MPFSASEQLPALAAALVRLRGETLGQIAEATSIRAANLSVWLRGREQVISAKRLVGLLHHLGVEGGRLRADVLHQWQDRGALDDCRFVLTTLKTSSQPLWLFQDDQPGLIKTRFLLAGSALIRIEIEPGIDQAVDLMDAVGATRIITSRSPLAGVPTTSLESARDVLLACAEQATTELGDDELLDGLLFHLSENIAGNTASPRAWQQLENALRFALSVGESPDNIASLIDDHYRKGGKPARGRNTDST